MVELGSEGDRREKKRREAERLRDVPPEVTLQGFFDLMRFTAHLSEAARRAPRN